VIFFGSSNYCLPLLETLKPRLKLVITKPDQPIGRKQTLTPSAVKVWAQKNAVPVATPAAREELTTILRNIVVDLGIVADFGMIIPKEAFFLPKLGIFNIHFSKLPEFRGPSPVQFTLWRGDKIAWITIFKLKHYPDLKIKMDSGPILWQKSCSINSDDTTSSLYTRLFEEIAKKISKINFEGSLTEQDHSKATYTRFLARQDGFVDYSKIADSRFCTQVYNQYRAMHPWPGLWTIKDGRRMKILKCHMGDSRLVIDEIQFEGKSPQKTFPDSSIFLRVKTP
jgi:methionyl-tRNA formyltransferase